MSRLTLIAESARKPRPSARQSKKNVDVILKPPLLGRLAPRLCSNLLVRSPFEQMTMFRCSESVDETAIEAREEKSWSQQPALAISPEGAAPRQRKTKAYQHENRGYPSSTGS